MAFSEVIAPTWKAGFSYDFPLVGFLGNKVALANPIWQEALTPTVTSCRGERLRAFCVEFTLAMLIASTQQRLSADASWHWGNQGCLCSVLARRGPPLIFFGYERESSTFFICDHVVLVILMSGLLKGGTS